VKNFKLWQIVRGEYLTDFVDFFAFDKLPPALAGG